MPEDPFDDFGAAEQRDDANGGAATNMPVYQICKLFI